MVRVSVRVDEAVRVGRDIVLTPTDIDADGVRLLARGRTAGGANDGEPFDAAHELTVGGTLNLGPHVVVTLTGIAGDVARLGVFAPPHMPVSVSE